MDLTEVWKKLDKKSTVWTLLIDDQSKLLTVSEYIDRFQKEGVKIQAPPLHYVQMIDQIVGGNPQMLQRPFGELVQIVAIVDYDFDNGMSKDELARKVLGEAGFEANKKRLHPTSQQQQQQQAATTAMSPIMKNTFYPLTKARRDLGRFCSMPKAVWSQAPIRSLSNIILSPDG